MNVTNKAATEKGTHSFTIAFDFYKVLLCPPRRWYTCNKRCWRTSFNVYTIKNVHLVGKKWFMLIYKIHGMYNFKITHCAVYPHITYLHIYPIINRQAERQRYEQIQVTYLLLQCTRVTAATVAYFLLGTKPACCTSPVRNLWDFPPEDLRGEEVEKSTQHFF